MLLPPGTEFSGADFQRHGADLEVRLPDGRVVVVVPGYFEGNGLPLVSADGITLAAQTVRSLAGPLAPAQFAQADGESNSGLIQIGVVDKVSGTVTARHLDGTRSSLQKGSVVNQGDVLETAGDGSVGLVFADRSTFSLGPSGRMVLDELIYDPTSQSGQATVSLLKGTFSFVSGQIAHSAPDAMSVRTPVMIIGVRGTTVAGQVDDGGQTQVALLGDPGGGSGEIVLFNGSGSQTVNVPNSLVTASSAFAPPPPPQMVPPQVLAQSFAAAVNSLPPPPSPSTHGVEWSTTPGKAQSAPVQEIQSRPGAGGTLDVSHPEGTRVIEPPKADPSGKTEIKPETEKAAVPQPETGKAQTQPDSQAPAAQAAPSQTASAQAAAAASAKAETATTTIADKITFLPVATTDTSSGIGMTTTSVVADLIKAVAATTTQATTTNPVATTVTTPASTTTTVNSVATTSGATGGTASVVTAQTQGRLVDGPIVGAVVFRDMNGNNVLDSGEPFASTGSDGRFTLAGSGGTIVALPGGRDAETGLIVSVPLKASGSATVVTPLTTLAQMIGEARVKELLGLSPNTDLLTTDPMGDLALHTQGTALIAAITTLSQGISALGVSATANDILEAVASRMASQGGGSFDLRSATTFSEVLKQVPGVNPADTKIATLAAIATSAASTAAGIVHGSVQASALTSIIGADVAAMTNQGLVVDLSDAADIASHLSSLVGVGMTAFNVSRGTAQLTAAQASGLTFHLITGGSAVVRVVDDVAAIAAAGDSLAGMPQVWATGHGDISGLKLSHVTRLELSADTSVTAAQLTSLPAIVKNGNLLTVAALSGDLSAQDLSPADSVVLGGDTILSAAQYLALGAARIDTSGHGLTVAVSGDLSAADLSGAMAFTLTGDAILSAANLTHADVTPGGFHLIVRGDGTINLQAASAVEQLELTGDATLWTDVFVEIGTAHILRNGHALSLCRASGDLTGLDLDGIDTLYLHGSALLSPEQVSQVVTIVPGDVPWYVKVSGDLSRYGVLDGSVLPALADDSSMPLSQYLLFDPASILKNEHLLTVTDISGDQTEIDLSGADILELTGDTTVSVTAAAGRDSAHVVKHGYSLNVYVDHRHADLTAFDLSVADHIEVYSGVTVTQQQLPFVVPHGGEGPTQVAVVPPAGSHALTIDVGTIAAGWHGDGALLLTLPDGGTITVTGGAPSGIVGSSGDTVSFDGQALGVEVDLDNSIAVVDQTPVNIFGFSTVVGTAHDDSLTATLGTVRGDGGDDRLFAATLDYSTSTAAVVADLSGVDGDGLVTVADGLGGTDTIRYIAIGSQTLIAGQGADTLIGGQCQDSFVLPENSVVADEILQGSADFADSLSVIGSNDLRLAQLGALGYIGVSGENTVLTINASQLHALAVEAGGVTIYSQDGAAGQQIVIKMDAAGSDLLSNFYGFGSIVLDGSEQSAAQSFGWGANSILGGDGDDLFTAVASDVMQGGDGDDILQVSGEMDISTLRTFAGIERISVAENGTLIATQAELDGITLDGSGGALTVRLIGTQPLNLVNWGADDHVEWVGTSGNDDLSIGPGISALRGRNGDDTLTGGTGNDTLYGDGDDDTLVGGDGNDVLWGGAGNDDIIGGDGTDTVVVESDWPAAPVSVNLTTGTTSHGNGQDVLTGIENALVQLSLFTETASITGDSGDNVLSLLANGFSGSAAIVGGAGSDTLAFLDDVSPYAHAWSISGIERFALAGDGNPFMVDMSNASLTASVTLDASGALANGLQPLRLPVTTGTDATINVVETAADILRIRAVSGTTLDASGWVLIGWGSAASGGIAAMTGGGALWLNAQDQTARTLTGTAMADIVTGGVGADTITGGGGADILWGGDGNDVFKFNAGDVVAGETINGSSGQDTLSLLGDVDFSGALIVNDTTAINILALNGHTATIAIDQNTRFSLVGSSGNDTVVVRPSNTSCGQTISAAGFSFTTGGTTGWGGTGTDRIVLTGTAYDDTLESSSIRESLVGGAGNDTFKGLIGSDTISGGEGDDVFDFSSATLQLSGVFDGGGGYDRMDMMAGGCTDLSSATVSSVERVDYGDSGTARSYFFNAQGFTGTTAQFHGAAAVTSLQFMVTQGGKYDLSGLIFTGTAPTKVVLGTGSINIYQARDVVGTSLADSMTGGSGMDWLEGGQGDDSVDGGGGLDVVSFAQADGGVTVILGEDDSVLHTVSGIATGPASVGTDSLYNVEGVEGSLYDDVLTMTGTGNAYAAINLLDYSNAIAAVTVDLGAGSASGGAGHDLFSGFEMVGGSAYDDTLVGTSGGGDWLCYIRAAASVSVDLAAGTASGGAGYDTFTGFEAVWGSAFADTLIGSSGDDTFVGGGGDDVIDGGGGINKVDYSFVSTSTGIVANMGSGTVTGPDGTDHLLNIQWLCGTGASDTITGSSGADIIDGGGGYDTINGGSGDDTIILRSPVGAQSTVNGGVGTDFLDLSKVTYGLSVNLATGSLNGGVVTGIESILGTSNNDVLIGSNNGGETFAGGGGIDTITTGGGADVILIGKLPSLSAGRDVVTDFTSGMDRIDLSDALLHLGNFGSLSTTTDAKQFAVSTVAMSLNIQNYAGDNSANGGIVVIGQTTGSAGAEIWYTSDLHAASTENSYQIATLQGQNTTQIQVTDFNKVL